MAYLKQNDYLPGTEAWDNMCGAYCTTYLLTETQVASFKGDNEQGSIQLNGQEKNARDFVFDLYHGTEVTNGVKLGENDKEVIPDYSCPVKIKDYLTQVQSVQGIQLYFDPTKGSRTVLEQQDMENVFKGLKVEVQQLGSGDWYLIALLNDRTDEEETKETYGACHYVLLVKKGKTLKMIDPLVGQEQMIENPEVFLAGQNPDARVLSGEFNYKFLRAGIYIAAN